MKIEQVTCYNCGSPKSDFYDSENGFNLVKCSQCGLLYVNPRPIIDEIAQAHKTGEHRGEEIIKVTGVFSEKKVRTYQEILNNFYGKTTGNLNAKKWLDVGCGHGEFLKALQLFSNNKYTVKGLEPNIYKQESARKQGIDVTFFDWRNHDEKYDCISLLNVYSHLPNPVEELCNWTALLKEDGELLIQTSDSANLASKDHHRPYYLPDHLSFASEKIVKNILVKIGFEVIQIKKYRFVEFPKPTLKKTAKETIKFFLPGEKSSLFTHLYPKHPNRDMWIRAKKISN